MAESIDNSQLKATVRYFDQIQRSSDRLGRARYQNIIKMNNELKSTTRYFDNISRAASKLASTRITLQVSLNDQASPALDRLLKKLSNVKSQMISASGNFTVQQQINATIKGLTLPIPKVAPATVNMSPSLINVSNNSLTNKSTSSAEKEEPKGWVEKSIDVVEKINTVFDGIKNVGETGKSIWGFFKGDKKDPTDTNGNSNSDTAANGSNDKCCCCCSDKSGSGGSSSIINQPNPAATNPNRDNAANGKKVRRGRFGNQRISTGGPSPADPPTPPGNTNPAQRRIVLNARTSDAIRNGTLHRTNPNDTAAGGDNDNATGGRRGKIKSALSGFFSMDGSGPAGLPNMEEGMGKLSEHLSGSNNKFLKMVGGGLADGGGKILKPLGFISDMVNIATSSEENRGEAVGSAVGSTAGTALGAVIGSAILPGIGTWAGSMVGGWAGEKLGGLVGGSDLGKAAVSAVGDGITGVKDYLSDKASGLKDGIMSWFGGGDKAKQEAAATPAVAQVAQQPNNPMLATNANVANPAMTTPAAQIVKNAATNSDKPASKGPGGDATKAVQINETQMGAISGMLKEFKSEVVNKVSITVPTGAVQVTVKENELDYEGLALQIGHRIANELRKSMQNMKPNPSKATPLPM
ncbi:hypothetical protein QE450_000455 [Paenibacillus sp. SORGH_AS306]|uniref:hypothetical protein n=1 Tax=unclassified Paenibacillus TaxID=185978 RepID=UPI00277E5F91|nr:MULTISPECIES: hypothetical protein [unclassified Paenibacillus]MDQ1232957.1 hypothetical protein [Paenibacillus sp. SORGH_AS_0306]MDR6110003.1 hypothetical protein [Paenibacillus sp. SORGH_AS_0338]